ncbi:MAG: hypothetical protein IJV60_05890 [Prevotella sp.]|nr:hypothetical protein [Prevotella sp.]MBQ8060060.1 hypothetical protein [Prevotella sp.]
MCARKGGLYPYVSTSNVFVKRPTPTLPVREGEWMRDEWKTKEKSEEKQAKSEASKERSK